MHPSFMRECSDHPLIDGLIKMGI